MPELHDILKDVHNRSTLDDSLSTLISGLKQQINDAFVGITLPLSVHEKLTAIFARAEIHKREIVDAVKANLKSGIGS